MSFVLPGNLRHLPPGVVEAGTQVLADALRAYRPSVPSPSLFSRSRRAVEVAPPLTGPLTYVALSASDGQGWGASRPWKEGWVPLLAERLPQPARLVNLGVGGITLPEVVKRTLPRAVEAQPDLVTVWLVVNDVLKGVPLERYRASLDELLGTLRAETGTRIAIGNLPRPPERVAGYGVPHVLRQIVAGAWNGTIADLANKHGALVVDLHRHWPVAQTPDFVCSDGFHPSTAGYRALAEVFHTALREHGVVGHDD